MTQTENREEGHSHLGTLLARDPFRVDDGQFSLASEFLKRIRQPDSKKTSARRGATLSRTKFSLKSYLLA